MVKGRRLAPRIPTKGSRRGIEAAVRPDGSGGSDTEYPIFSMHHLAVATHCVSTCEQREQADVALALERRARFTWGTLRQMPHVKLGYERLPRESIRATIPSYFTEDERPIVFRMSDRGRLIGFRQNAQFHIVWIDFHFEVYPH